MENPYQPNKLSLEVQGKRLSPTQTRYFLLVFIISILLLGLILSPFWQLLILAFLLAGIFKPLYNWLSRWMSMWTASFLTCTLIVFIVFVPLTFCIGALSTEALNLYHLGMDSNLLLKLQQIIQNNTLAMETQAVLADFGIVFEANELNKMVSNIAGSAGLLIYNQASTWAANIMSFVLQFCFLILVIYFLLIEIDRLILFMKKLSPLPDAQDDLLMHKFMEISGVILIGNGISGLFQGILGGLLFAAMDLNSPVLWGGIMAILAFLPIFGIGMVLMPTSLILWINGFTGQAIITFIFYIILSFSVEYLFKPKLIGNQVKMHTLLVFLSIIGGMSIFGVLGIIYGPLIVTAFLTLTDIYLKEYLVNPKFSGEKL